jgi:hypothetical protein
MKKVKVCLLAIALVVLVGLSVGLTQESDAYIPMYWWEMSPYQSCINGLYCMDCCEPFGGPCYQSACRPASDEHKACTPN